jgi:hypothetical protein
MAKFKVGDKVRIRASDGYVDVPNEFTFVGAVGTVINPNYGSFAPFYGEQVEVEVPGAHVAFGYHTTVDTFPISEDALERAD